MAEGAEAVAVSLVELGLELDPVQPQGVEEALHDVHAEENAGGDSEENGESYVDVDAVDDDGSGLEGGHKGLLEEDKRQLLMGQ